MTAPEPDPASGHPFGLVAASTVAVAAQLVVLYLPGQATPSVALPGLDKAIHALVFAVPVWLLARLTGRVLLVAGIFVGHAIASEIIQARLIPGRMGDPWDLLADLLGIAAAVIAVRAGRVSTLGRTPPRRGEPAV